MDAVTDADCRVARAEQEALLAALYDELRRIARRILAGDAGAVLFQPTELVHEAALRLMKLERMAFNDRTHYLATAARVMRQVLIDEVRRARAAKRQRFDVQTLVPDAIAGEAPLDLELLDSALTRLDEISPERARVVELRFYAGLSVEEIANITGVSERTVKRQWRAARAWLLDTLASG